jgi:hypothetical protein
MLALASAPGCSAAPVDEACGEEVFPDQLILLPAAVHSGFNERDEFLAPITASFRPEMSMAAQAPAAAAGMTSGERQGDAP